jgi:CheY-like chemotaxis protein
MNERVPKILLIDDDDAIRRLYGDILRSEGFDITPMASAQAALESLLKGDTYDLVITDIMMAKMDGWDLLQAIRKRLGISELKLPVIVMSAFESGALEFKALQYGANGHYVKGTPVQKLIREAKIQTGLIRSNYSAT